MANSLMQIVSDGSLSTIPLTIKFFEQSHIKVFVNSVELPDDTYTFAWSGATTLTITPAVALGAEVSIRRKTPADEVLHDFQAGAVFSEVSVDENFRQELFLLQEASEQSLVTDLFDDLDMHGNGIRNVRTATLPGDAVNLAQAVQIAEGGGTSTLRAELLAPGGASILGTTSGLTVQQQIGSYITVRPVGNPVGDKAALLAAAASAYATGMAVNTLKGDVFTLDNSDGTGITFTQDGFQLMGLGRIKATSDANTLVLTTGKGVKVHKGIQLEGPGTWRPDLGGDGNPPALLKMTGDDSDTGGLLFIEPYCAALFVQGGAGGLDKKNTILCSYAGSVALPFIFGIYYRPVADRIAMGNIIDGCIQGICGGGDGSGTYTVARKDGEVTSDLCNVTVTMNTCVNQLDHSIYFSNNTRDVSILNNKGLKSVNDLIKIEGGPNQVIGNTGKGGSAITGRNVFKTRISGNIMTTTLSSEFAYAVLLYEQLFKRPTFDIEIDHNQFTHEGVVSKGAVRVLGEVWADQSYQCVLGNINIHDNVAKGYGNEVEGFQYSVDQRLFSTNPVTGSMAVGVHIDNNDGEFPIGVPDSTIGIDLGRGIKGGSCVNNRIKGFKSMGIRKLGVQDFNTALNNLEVAAGATALGGIYERPKDTTLHYNSQNNTYSTNKVIGSASRQVWMSDETCYNEDRIILVRTNTGAETILASQCPKQVVYTNVNNGTVISIDNNANTPWPDKSDLVITNSTASNSLTVAVLGNIAVAAGTSLRLIRNSGAWVKAN